MSPAVPALLLGAAVALVLVRSSPTARLRAVAPGQEQAAVTPGRGRVTGPAGRAVAAGLLGLALLTIVGGPAGALLALVTFVGMSHLLDHADDLIDGDVVRELEVAMPLALDLLAACLAGGAYPAEALPVVAAAVEGPCGQRLRAVAAALAVGTAEQKAWTLLAAGDRDGPAAAAARALVRAGSSGAAVAQALARTAADVRVAQRAADTRRAKRAGVLAVGPLAVCFLPAFVLLGVVPVVLGLVGPLLRLG